MITHFYKKIHPVLITIFGLLITIIPKVNGQSNERQVELELNPQKFCKNLSEHERGTESK